MLNIPAAFHPTNWEDYFGHERQVRRVMNWASNAPESLPRSIFVSGHSGTGKTTLALLLIKAVHCENRKPGDPNPCNECNSCKSVDARLSDRTFSNVHWVQPGGFNEETVQASVKNALLAGAKGPNNSADPSRDVMFLVFDEWHKIDSRSRQQVLIRSEVETRHNVCYIFITMMADQLPFMDRVALQARCQTINLLPLSTEQIETFLHTKVKPQDSKLTDAAIRVIAENSEGSLRMALSIYGGAKGLDEWVTADVAHETVQSAPGQLRKELWRLIEEGTNAYAVKQKVESILQVCNKDKLVRQLKIDIIKADNATNRWEALRLLSAFRSNPNELADIVSMLQVLGVKRVSGSVEEEKSDRIIEKFGATDLTDPNPNPNPDG